MMVCDGDVTLFPDFFSLDESASYFEKLKTEIAWKHEPIVMFGKSVMQPRLTAWYGDAGASYRYSGVTHVPLPWNETLIEIKTKIENQTHEKFNAVLLNQYRDQKDSMGWHRDNEKELGVDPVIASVTFGETRRFLLRRHRDDDSAKSRETVSLDLKNGSLLMMRGKSQTHWEHSLPKSSRVLGVRMNLTFRLLRL